MQLYIIRHGQSFNNALWAETGSSNGRLSDPPLTEIGEQQANCIAQYIYLTDQKGKLENDSNRHNRQGFNLTHLYTSLMLRAVQTGHAIAEALDMPLDVWECIHEWGGIFLDDPETGEPTPLPGANRSFFENRFSRLIIPDWLQENGWWNNRPFEQREDTIHRARQFATELLERHGDTDDRVAIVTHGGFASMFYTALFNFKETNLTLGDEEFHTWLRINNTGFSRLDFEDNYIVQIYMNRVDHLPLELIT
jgi:2,3-bisphosphoglycerate-dependent phosphoglycerate mutase